MIDDQQRSPDETVICQIYYFHDINNIPRHILSHLMCISAKSTQYEGGYMFRNN